MKKLAFSALLLFVGVFAVAYLANAATCEVKPVCMDSIRLGMQTEDCKIISAEEMMRQLAGAFGGDTAATYSCYIGCKDGACIKDNTPDVCTDTDGGKDYFVKGKVSTKGNGEQGNSSDICSDKNTLSETSCSKKGDKYTIDVSSYKCPNGCVDGACVKDASGGTGSKCTDSDGGKDIFKVGIITINGKAQDLSDTCGLDPQTINEKFCLPNGTYSSEDLKCPGLCEIMPDTYGAAYCTKSCEKSDGYYCHNSIDGNIGIAFLTKDCKWEKATPCQSNACGGPVCATFGALVDSDGDGLLDVNEAKWGTDPKKFDTDGDGFGDMTEIFGGYNPLGPGKFTAAQVSLATQLDSIGGNSSAAANGITSAPDFSTSTVVATSVPDLAIVTATEATATIPGITDAKSTTGKYPPAGLEIMSAINQNPAIAYIIFGIIALLIIALYAYTAICLQFIARKLNVSRAWLAWIPIASTFLMIKCAGKPYWWFLLFFVPILNIVIGVLLWVYICQKLNRPGWLAILMLISPINLIVMGYLAFAGGDSQINYPPQIQNNNLT